MNNIKKLLCAFIITSTFINTTIFASVAPTGPGIPTFDFTNLVQAIESLSNAVNFYEDTLKNLELYKNKIIAISKKISSFEINQMSFSLTSIKSLINEIKDHLNLCKDEAVNLFNETENLFKSFDKSLYSYFYINTSNTFQNSIKALREEININRISSVINSNIATIENKINEIENSKNKWIEIFNENHTKAQGIKRDAEEFIKSLISSNPESIVSLLNLNIENSNLISIESLNNLTESQEINFIDNVNKQLDYYKKSLDELKEKSNDFIYKLKEIETLNTYNKNKRI